MVLIQQQVLQDGAGACVYLAGKNRAKRATLTLGATEDQGVLVLGGLEKGQILIVKGVECLQDGKKIKDREQAPRKSRGQSRRDYWRNRKLPGEEDYGRTLDSQGEVGEEIQSRAEL